MWIDGLKIYDKKVGINWKWQSMDGVITKAPLGVKKYRPNPTDRSKSGTKRSLLVDSQGIPLGITVYPFHPSWKISYIGYTYKKYL